jgi:RecA/RadA recombinase
MKKIISSFKGINKALGNGGYRRKHIFTFAGRTGSGKTSLVLTEALKMLRAGFKVMYVGELDQAALITKLFHTNEKQDKNYGCVPFDRFFRLMAVCKNLIVPRCESKFGPKVKELISTIKKEKPDVIILDGYEGYRFDRGYLDALPDTVKQFGGGVMREFLADIRKLSNIYNFATFLTVHTYDRPTADEKNNATIVSEVQHGAAFISDFIVVLDSKVGTMQVWKNRWGSNNNSIKAEFFKNKSTVIVEKK